PDARLEVKFTEASRLVLSTAELPSKTENAPIVGESSIHDLAELRKRRPQEVAFLLAKLTLEKYFRQDGSKKTDKAKNHRFDADVQSWRFPRLLEITRQWLDQCVQCKDNTFPQLLLLLQFAHDASDRIYKAIVESTPGTKALKPILRPYDTIGSTRHVDFDTTRRTYATRPDKCHLSDVVADTKSWEQKLAQTLEDMPEVFAYVKNQNLGFTIPYTLNGEEHNYHPDFIVLIDDGRGSTPSPPLGALGERTRARGYGSAAERDLLHLILECTGQKKKDKQAKVITAQSLWVPAVNNHGEFGRWAFLEIDDPWDAEKVLRAKLEETQTPAMKSFPRINKTPGVCGGDACIGNSRIPVWTLVSLQRQGASDRELLEAYPSLTQTDLEAAWQYYAARRQEVEDAIRENDEAMHG
ncbi:MAG: DUF433 domain-containing protein, partial [Verrucomicrobiales bacterium]|nr:DUF433 domain-containing protein [Verrucomicrobiales bacterium]